jgi:hypothetical protein
MNAEQNERLHFQAIKHLMRSSVAHAFAATVIELVDDIIDIDDA